MWRDGGEHKPASPSALNEQGPSPREAIQQKAKGKFGSKHPRKAAHSRRSHNQQSAPDETTEIKKAKSRCGGTVASTRASVPVNEQAGAIPAERQSTESQRKVRIKAPARRPIAAVVTTQQSAPDETTEIRKPRVGVEGRWRARETSVPVKTG